MGWTLGHIQKLQTDVMNYANRAATDIKNELIGDGDEAKYRGRLRTAIFELSANPNFAPSYFPVFDEALFELPNTDEPDKNKQMLDALSVVYGKDGASVMVYLQTIVEWANYIVEDVARMLDEVCKFVGYNTTDPTEPQQVQQPEPQQKDLHYYCKKAVEKGYLIINNGGYKRSTWSKAQLAYFLGHFLKGGTFPDKEYSAMFAESRLGKALGQLINNKTGNGKPKGYEVVDTLLKE